MHATRFANSWEHTELDIVVTKAHAKQPSTKLKTHFTSLSYDDIEVYESQHSHVHYFKWTRQKFWLGAQVYHWWILILQLSHLTFRVPVEPKTFDVSLLRNNALFGIRLTYFVLPASIWNDHAALLDSGASLFSNESQLIHGFSNIEVEF